MIFLNMQSDGKGKFNPRTQMWWVTVQEMQDSRWKAQGRDTPHLAKIPKYFEGILLSARGENLRMMLFPEFNLFAFKIMEEEQWNPRRAKPTRDNSLKHQHAKHTP